MRKKTEDPMLILQRNIKFLMLHLDLTYPAINKINGKNVTSRYIEQIVKDGKRPRIDKVDAIAKVFGLEMWQLVHPELSEDIMDSEGLNHVIEHYIRSTPEGRENIAQTARFSPKNTSESTMDTDASK